MQRIVERGRRGRRPEGVSPDVHADQRVVAGSFAAAVVPLVGADVVDPVRSDRYVEIELFELRNAFALVVLGSFRPSKDFGGIVFLKDPRCVQSLLHNVSVAEKLDLDAGDLVTGLELGNFLRDRLVVAS